MKVHNARSHQDLVNLDISALWSDVRAELRGMEDPQRRDRGGYPYPNFPSLVKGYDVAMYGYVGYVALTFSARASAGCANLVPISGLLPTQRTSLEQCLPQTLKIPKLGVGIVEEYWTMGGAMATRSR